MKGASYNRAVCYVYNGCFTRAREAASNLRYSCRADDLLNHLYIHSLIIPEKIMFSVMSSVINSSWVQAPTGCVAPRHLEQLLYLPKVC